MIGRVRQSEVSLVYTTRLKKDFPDDTDYILYHVRAEDENAVEHQA
jgi:hypothetical protein